MVRILCVLLLWGLGAGQALAQKPVPPLTGRVVDLADILSPETERTVEALLAEHEAATSNQVAVLTIPSLDGEPLEDYSLRVARAWQLGTSEFDNGVLLLIAYRDRKIRIEVGYGLEGVIPDAIAKRSHPAFGRATSTGACWRACAPSSGRSRARIRRPKTRPTHHRSGRACCF